MSPVDSPRPSRRDLVARGGVLLLRFGGGNEVRTRLPAGGRWIRTFGSRTRHQAVRPRRGRFPVIGSSPHWPGGTGISNLPPPAGWISALERGRFQGHKQKRKLKSVAPFARNRKFESISLQRGVYCEPDFRSRDCLRCSQAKDFRVRARRNRQIA